MGYYSAKFRYVHIFWNSQYVGMNQFVEKPGSGNLADYFGTQRENFETIAAGTATNEIGKPAFFVPLFFSRARAICME